MLKYYCSIIYVMFVIVINCNMSITFVTSVCHAIDLSL